VLVTHSVSALLCHWCTSTNLETEWLKRNLDHQHFPVALLIPCTELQGMLLVYTNKKALL